MREREDGISTDQLDAVERWIAALGAIPPAARVYDVGPGRAAREFGIGAATAQRFAERGLPCVVVGGESRFAWSDLHYIALRLGSARLYLRTMRSWAQAVAAGGQERSRLIELRYRTYATVGAVVDVLWPDGRREETVVGADQIVARLSLETDGRDRTFPAIVQQILRRAAALDFYILPPTLAGDLEFVRRAGLSGCMTASRLVVDECRQRGIEARMAYGLLLATPLGTPHEWAEIRVGDGWAPADPLLLGILGRFAGLDVTRWPCTRSPNAVLLRLAAHTTPIVDSADGPVQTSFVVSVADR